MHISSVKSEAIKLRKEGYSYSFISSRLKVAKSTLSLWLKDISFVPNETTQENMKNGLKNLVSVKRSDKFLSLREASDYADKNIGDLSEREVFMLGLGIYIGEGSKSNNFVRIVNSDPKIIRFALRWFKHSFGLKDSNFKVRIHIYPDNKEKDTVEFWSQELGLPKTVFHSSYVDRRVKKSANKQKLLSYGTAHLTVVSNGDKTLGVLLHRKILASIDRVLK